MVPIRSILAARGPHPRSRRGDVVEAHAGADIVHAGARDDVVRLGRNPLLVGPTGSSEEFSAGP